MIYTGIRIYESVYAVKDGPLITYRRSWRERLISWPWRPWIATWTEISKVPTAYYLGNLIIAHPMIASELRKNEINYGRNLETPRY